MEKKETKVEASGSLYKILDDVIPEIKDLSRPDRTEIREQIIQQVLHQRKNLVIKDLSKDLEEEEAKELKEEIIKIERTLTRQIKEMKACRRKCWRCYRLCMLPNNH